jgi:diguanylate cyclase (GGDEF)-like protein
MPNLSSKQKITLLFFISFVLILLISRIYISNNINNLFFNSENIIKLIPSKNSDNTNYIKYTGDREIKNNIFSYTLSKKELNSLDEDIKAILIYKLTGTKYEIYFNNTKIGLNGEKDKSNIWNDVNVFAIPDKIINEDNNIKIITNNLYESGFLDFPPVISNLKKLQIIKNHISLWIDGFIWFTLGILTASILLFITIGYLNKKDMTIYILLALAQLFLMVSLLDYLVFKKLSIQIITFKKIVISSYYFSTAIISFAFNKYFKKKSLMITGIITFALAIIIFSFSNIISLMNMIAYFNFVLLTNMIFWIIYSYRESKNKIPFLFITLGSLSLFFASLFDIINIFFNNPYISIFMFGVSTFIISLNSLLIKDYSYMNKEYKKEKNNSKINYQHSIKDSLTGTYNRRFFDIKLKELKGDYTLIIFDIDNFKKINDENGHYYGDEILKKVAKITKSIVRKSDIICRYGGDEFIVILKNCSKNKGINITNKLMKKIDKKITIENNNSALTISAGLFRKTKNISNDKVFKKADDLLIKAKNNGKNRLEY